MQRMRSYKFYNFRFRLSLVWFASNIEAVAHKQDNSDKSTKHVGRFYSKPEMHAREQPEPARLAERCARIIPLFAIRFGRN